MYYSDDWRQLAWDSLLIKGWGKDVRMQSLVDMYKKDFTEQQSPFSELRRFPYMWDLGLSARVFVARYIPNLSAKLWDSPQDAQFWLMMHGDKVNRQDNAADAESRRKDINLIKQSMREDKKAIAGKAERKELYAAHRPSGQWNVCK
jgi:hypothetical protein